MSDLPVPETAVRTPLTPEDLVALLDGLGIATARTDHVAVFTVAESKTLRIALPGHHTKNLFLKDKKGRLFLVSALESTAIDLKRLHEALGASGRLSFGSAELLMATLGVTPGSVTAFAVANDRAGAVTMVLDAALMDGAPLNFHPLVNTATLTIAREDMLRFLEAVGHAPRILALPAPPAAQSDAG
ncbi:prolyl-tRNA synthetase associated domain-containing protein [Bosea sp. TWI1241]|uniref:prolyl-tRNA synthetase associated domain-containing protein n=1 Tax=Bosea sp. TWI1241 TaxID=3148904 RepID=UPI0032084CFF